jgi:hypothetical protein
MKSTIAEHFLLALSMRYRMQCYANFATVAQSSLHIRLVLFFFGLPDWMRQAQALVEQAGLCFLKCGRRRTPQV